MVGNPECNKERGFKNQLYIELGKKQCYAKFKVFFYLNVVAIAGIGLRVVDLVVDGLKGGLEGFSIGLLLSSINASSVSSSSTNSALKLKKRMINQVHFFVNSILLGRPNVFGRQVQLSESCKYSGISI